MAHYDLIILLCDTHHNTMGGGGGTVTAGPCKWQRRT